MNMTTITLTVHPITKAESLFAKKFGLRVFAELDRNGKEVAFFGELHESTINSVPRITPRKKQRLPIRVDRLLKSRPKSKRVPIQAGSDLARVAAYCHKRCKKQPVARGILQDEMVVAFGLTSDQVRPAITALLDKEKYDHLTVAD